MARKKPKGKSTAFTMFNVTYEDDTVTSNRRVASELLDQSFGDGLLDLARTAIQEQDNEISQRSNQRRPKIKSIKQA
ncbi:MAG: hypothetical protein OEW37_08490 [Rhodospirillaceae bacterium]|nr:hypothetical protein [Rhodospirillaceae bacterium]